MLLRASHVGAMLLCEPLWRPLLREQWLRRHPLQDQMLRKDLLRGNDLLVEMLGMGPECRRLWRRGLGDRRALLRRRCRRWPLGRTLLGTRVWSRPLRRGGRRLLWDELQRSALRRRVLQLQLLQPVLPQLLLNVLFVQLLLRRPVRMPGLRLHLLLLKHELLDVLLWQVWLHLQMWAQVRNAKMRRENKPGLHACSRLVVRRLRLGWRLL